MTLPREGHIVRAVVSGASKPGRRLIAGVAVGIALLGAEAPASAATTYERTPFKLQPGTQHEPVLAKCPGGSHVLSGGIGMTGLDGRVVSSLPVDLGDQDEKPDDAWSVTTASPVDNGQGADRMKVHAACATGKTPKYVFAGIEATGVVTETVSCPDGTSATGAGGLTLGAMGTTYLHTWSPFDFGGAGGDAVKVVLQGSVSDSGANVVAVCVKDLELRYPSKTLTIESPFGGTDPVFCKQREFVVGGGGYVADPGPGVTVRMVDAFPDDRPNEAGSRTEDGWAVSFFPDPFSAEPSAEIVAACAK